MSKDKCIKCNIDLIIPITWSESKKKYSDYRCIKCTTAYRKEWALRRGEKEVRKRRDNHFKREYGITIDDFDKMMESQNNKCKICSIDVKTTFNVDHDHSTNKVRRILCWNCNIGLGKFNDDPILLKNAIKYLGED